MGSPVLHDERVRKILAKNVRAFLAMMDISENALAQKCKISQKQVNNLTHARTGCGIDALAEIAEVFGCEPWMLLVDSLPDAIARQRRLSRLVKRYVTADEADQDLIEALAEKAASKAA